MQKLLKILLTVVLTVLILKLVFGALGILGWLFSNIVPMLILGAVLFVAFHFISGLLKGGSRRQR